MKPYYPNSPSILTVFGATGDLMGRKIVPSLYHLYRQKLLPDHVRIVGFARRGLSQDDFQKYIEQMLCEKKLITKKNKHVETFLSYFDYVQGDFDKVEGYKNLKTYIETVEDEWKICANKLYFLAVPPTLVSAVIKNLKHSKLSEPCGGDAGWARVLVEKPIGSDAKSADVMEKVLSVLKQEQIYRIDHYFGKEMIQGILNFRFSNNLFEDSWDNEQIEKIEMRLFEEIGVEDRGEFYDAVGALRDVGQNHLLSVLALLTMEHPENYNDTSIRASREKVLAQLHQPSLADVKQHTYRAQYEGYEKIEGVKRNSDTETYFKLKTEIQNKRWRGVPIYIESGKRMGKACKEIVVTFRHKEPCICPPSGPVQNKVIFSLHPHQEIKISFWQRKPGFDLQLEQRDFIFSLYKRKTKLPYVEEYAKLLYDAMIGDQTWFVSKQEVASQWRAVDPILTAWQKNMVPLHTYTSNIKDVAKEAEVFLASHEHVIAKDIGIIGLGRMGGGLARNLLRQGWHVVGHNRTASVTKDYQKKYLLDPAMNMQEFVDKLPTPRVVWLMLPNGKPIDDALFGKEGLVNYLDKGDIVIDGGNSYFKHTIERGKKLKKYGIKFLDAGVSGGPSGARNGACIMIGGDKKTFEYCEQIFKDMAQVNGYEFFPGSGAGHFVKMVHNGIEYGMMQAIGEGFNIMKKSKYKLDLSRITRVYNEGSVIESHLIEWLWEAFDLFGTDLKKISGKVSHSGEGEWTVKTAKEMRLKAKIIEESLKFREDSQKKPDYTGQVVSALRGRFGEHEVTSDF